MRLLRSLLTQNSRRALSTPAKPRILAKWLGKDVSYADGLAAQAAAKDAHLGWLKAHPEEPSPHNVLLLLEHKPVYTVGLRSAGYSAEEEGRLRSLGADFVRSDRGGLITFHGPGQLVGYPLLDLAAFGRAGAVRWYVQRLEAVVEHFARERFGVAAKPIPGCTGVWVAASAGRRGDVDRKMAALGIHVAQRRLTSHGFALNADVDLAWFDHIVPCGIQGKGVTSLSQEYGWTVSPINILRPFVDSFGHVFGAHMELDKDFPGLLP